MGSLENGQEIWIQKADNREHMKNTVSYQKRVTTMVAHIISYLLDQLEDILPQDCKEASSPEWLL